MIKYFHAEYFYKYKLYIYKYRLPVGGIKLIK